MRHCMLHVVGYGDDVHAARLSGPCISHEHSHCLPLTCDHSQRKRAEKELTPEEAAFMAKREAARQRVAQRTSQGFGYL